MDAEELTLQTEPTASEKLIVLAHSSKNGRAPSTGARPFRASSSSRRARLPSPPSWRRPSGTPGTVRPLGIVTPTNASHAQAAVLCGHRHGIRVRVRSGGHDYEFLSYRSERPEAFAVVDLANLRSVRVNRARATAWVDSGATAYFNYRDLDLGRNVVVGNVSSYEAGKVWGEKYFKGNYKRLALAKGKIDPDDYFRNEQSIPPLVPRS
ncbi:reticuline oxidase-like protein [Panicum miliaceum]|uniref:Reticuline oxidase-like protein n=1 Tax=Panicum miliaceum TaxID=4540 RepID=A0A3L6PFS7_PANMI|nr:reticuline oxidase-like protein [Panicum miliaceum]